MSNDTVQYWRLGKFRVYQHTYGGFLALTALGVERLQNWMVCLTGVLSFQLMISAGCALDDLTGNRNGSDYRNYVGASGEFARSVAMKPLLSGRLTERQVVGWAACSMAASVIVGGVCLLGATGSGRLPALALFVLCLLLIPQYSWGLQASYHPIGGESVLVVTHVLGVLWPAVAVASSISPVVGADATLFALGFLLISLCSNENDRIGDREVGRKTIAVMFGTSGTSVALIMAFVFEVVGVVVLITVGAPRISCWLLAAVGPGLAVGAAQLWAAVLQQRWMYARTLGMKAFNLMFVGLMVFNISTR